MNRSLLTRKNLFYTISCRRSKTLLHPQHQQHTNGRCFFHLREYHHNHKDNKDDHVQHPNQKTHLLKTQKLPSSSPDETTADDPSPKHQQRSFLKLDPRAIFPWRHSPYPLSRLIPNTPEFTSQGGYMGPNLPPWNILVRTMSWINATGFLGGRAWTYIGWKKELEEGFKLAFAMAVQGVLMDIYRVPNNDDDTNEESNDNNNNDDNLESTDESITPSIQFDHKINPLGEDEIPCNLNHDDTIQTQTRDMLDSNLISLYKSAHEHMKHKLHIQLRSTPKSATIMSLCTIPFLTKEEVIQKPALKHSFRNIAKALHKAEIEKGSQLSYFEIGNQAAIELDELANRQMIRRGDGLLEVTVVAQVSIQCDELFSVVDIETGETIQGDPDGLMKEVTHLVRFEIVVGFDPGNGTTSLGSWQITDWDDLLDGNVWFI